MHMTVSIRLDEGYVVSATWPLGSLTDEEISFTGRQLVRRAQEEAFMVLAEGE